MKQKVAEFSGKDIFSYTIENNNGLKLTALNYGAVITELLVPDRNSKAENVVVNYNNLSDYEDNPYYLGAVIGRTSGRTKDAELSFNGKTFQLAANDGRNHLHGGDNGLAKRLWHVTEELSALEFSYTSPDGEDGYPGTVTFNIRYELTASNELKIKYEAQPDEDTPINLTNHTYFNLSGDKKRTVEEHELEMASSSVYELNDESIPVGTLSADTEPVFDFRKPRKLKEAFTADHRQVEIAGSGIDHPFILDGNPEEERISLTDAESGRAVGVKTDDPAVVVYTGNQIEAEPLLNGGTAKKYDGICLETQMPPNETERYVISKNDVYRKQTIFSFRTD